ncbi:unnamed protein product [Cercopithifilaria johnstoni]|uniref:Uncharacterized protein n=1 Tax=Cercopithifilaria johnstoni TaxID=2874296 RepID=A0A8J2M152_9BILA|nr:unnamed protein product [Cercopithifilaria johnstoni]
MCSIEICGQTRSFFYSLLITAYQSLIILSTLSSLSPLLVSSFDPKTSHLSVCFSCASTAYLNLWNQLMHHYFPPKNFTDRCWEPDSEIGTVPCRGSCFILVEEIYEHFSTHAVMRGCVNRFLLFGLDEDIRGALTDKSECRITDRRLFHLVALTPQTDLVMMCSCMGSLCNYANMDHILSIAVPSAYNAFLSLLVLVNAASTQPTTVGQENKNKVEEIKDMKKDEEMKIERKKDEEQKKEKKKNNKKEDEKKSKKEKKNGQAERKEETEKVEEDRQNEANPIVTPVSDEDEVILSFSSIHFHCSLQKKKYLFLQLPAETQKTEKGFTVNITQDELPAKTQKKEKEFAVNVTQEEKKEVWK